MNRGMAIFMILCACVLHLTLGEAFGLDPQLRAKAHEVKVHEIKSGKDGEFIWNLRDNAKLADIIIFEADTGEIESKQIEILDNWVRGGGCLWLKSPLPIGNEWSFALSFSTLIYKEQAIGVELRFAKLLLENREGVTSILPHALTTGMRKIEVEYGNGVMAIKHNFGLDTEVILQYKGIAYTEYLHDKYEAWIEPYGTERYGFVEKKYINGDKRYEPRVFPVLVYKPYGRGKVLFGRFDVLKSYDWERFWFNLREWAVGYPVPAEE